MRVPTLAIALLAHLSQLTSAAPIDNSALEARSVQCTNYPGQTAGSTISKRSDSPFDISSLAPRSTIAWCREGSDFWISFPTPGGNIATAATFNSDFVDAMNVCNQEDGQGHGSVDLPTSRTILSNVNGITMYGANKGGLTWDRLHVGIEIMQNYVYVTSKYGAISATVYDGGALIGTLTIGVE